VSKWILCTWNGEIPLIFELPLGFSVVEELEIISSRESRDVIVVWVEVKGGCFHQWLPLWFDHASCGGGGDAGWNFPL